MNFKTIVLAVLAVAVLAYGYYFVKGMSFGTPVVGNTFNSAKVAAINIAPATASATSSSIYNSDANDRYITDAFAMCTGVGTSLTAYSGSGLAALLLRMATTSSSAPANLTNTNYAANIVIGTSTTATYNATSTEGVITGYSRIWPSGSYLTIQPNATNTAACNVGVHYLVS